MSESIFTRVGILVLLSVPLLGGCSSSTDPENSGGSSSAGSSSNSAGSATNNNSSGSSSTSEGGSSSSVGVGGTSSAAAGSSGNPDPSCVSNGTAKEGAACTQDCMVSCGHNGMGTKTCTCAGGIFDNCSCPRPAAYMGAPTAPLCPTTDGMIAGLKDMPCEVEWDECIGADPTTGPTKMGCACLKETAASALKWECGSSNQWYTLAQ